ncbi:bidirectional sugar transporter SWEET4-like [Dendrobium catenatum]|uniref:bidirectional sugar transporter SWEET4-like n=1 Tax=Dendrobium catenatum TaxID=906689 RepID=UPI0010A05E13|nr:bidirectional sugar transporter SWEET4-like [Dendrobium catenatum]
MTPRSLAVEAFASHLLRGTLMQGRYPDVIVDASLAEEVQSLLEDVQVKHLRPVVELEGEERPPAVGIIGNAISFVLFLSPMPTFFRICKKKSVEHFSVVPYVATLLNCMLWVLYGLPFVKPNSTLIITINGAGTVIELIYIFIYLLYSDGSRRIKALVLLFTDITFVAVVTAIILSIFKSHERRTLIVGILCIIFCIMMYASPLSIMKRVIRTKSVEYMPLYLSIAYFFNGLCWTTYSLIHLDVNLTIIALIPNAIGLLFAIAQLLLHAIYNKSTKQQPNEVKSEVALSEVNITH